MKVLFTIALIFFSFQSFTQNSAYLLDYNSVAANLNDNGLLFTTEFGNGPSYAVPKGGNLHVIYNSSFWIGAIDSIGYLHMAAMRFNGIGQDYFSGPYSVSDSYNDPLYLQKYDQSIWAVTRTQINDHIANYGIPGYLPAPAIANWPGNGDASLGVATNLAPFVDFNNDNIYDPIDGDYPDVRGDEAAYIILNDAKDEHTFTAGDPLQIELHIMVSQYASNDFLDSTTFLNFRLFNRGNTSYSNLKFGFYMDGDIGKAADDFFGCNPSKDLMYFYNGDNDDESFYGLNPPAAGLVSLSYPMESCGYFNSSYSFPYTDPQTAMQYYNFLNALWSNGTPWTYGGLGFPSSPGGTTTPTNFMFDGDPLTGIGWSEVTNNSNPGDRRGVMTLQTMSSFPNQVTCYDLAVIYSRSGGDNLQNVQSLTEIADSVKQFYMNQATYNCNQVTAGFSEFDEFNLEVYPNPSSGKITIQSRGEYDLSIVDLNGRLIQSFSQKITNSIVDLHLNKGVYLLEFATKEGRTIKRVIISD